MGVVTHRPNHKLVRLGVEEDGVSAYGTTSNSGSLSNAAARLNADGDEIMSDDDESPHTRRLRMRLSHGMHPTPAQRFSARFSDDFQSRVPDGQESASDQGAMLLGSNIDDNPRPHSYWPYPLPTFVEDMLQYPKPYHKCSHHNIPVSTTTCLYGR